MKLDDIKAIIELMSEHGLTEFEKEEEGVRLAIKRGSSVPTVVQMGTPLVPAVASGIAAAPPTTTPAAETKDDDANFALIKAPFVGTFYRASAPDADPYVKIGQEVGPETVLCILEAMKVMNEIKAEVSGVVREILVENAHAVQFGQPLFKIEKK